MPSKDEVEALIREAFSDVEYPGDGSLAVRDYQGKEPPLVEQEFKGKNDWKSLDPEFIDKAPCGFGSALNFFSIEAFRFYLPAYLIADLYCRLKLSEPILHLTHGLDHSARWAPFRHHRYGGQTYFDYRRDRFSVFNKKEASAIVAYLDYMRNSDNKEDYERQIINETLENFWREQAT